ncbi:MAG: AtpZ/AtpI family protein [Sphingopyxis sp.]|nr:AtpZ/AtpI family protein [Sphingopyxis sp.]
MSGTNRDPNSNSEDSRLTSLEQRLDRAEAAEAERTAGAKLPEADPDYRLGSRVMAELLGGMIGGSLLGWLFDRLVGTTPWGLLVMLMLGIIVAFRNILRITSPPRK